MDQISRCCWSDFSSLLPSRCLHQMGRGEGSYCCKNMFRRQVIYFSLETSYFVAVLFRFNFEMLEKMNFHLGLALYANSKIKDTYQWLKF